MKEVNEGHKGQFEDHKVMNMKISPHGWDHLVPIIMEIPYFKSFKVVKAKKAATVTRNTKLHSGTSGNPKLLLYTFNAIIILPKRPMLLYFSCMSLLKAKNGLARPSSKVEGH